MPQSIAAIYIHIVFSTKNRIDLLKNDKIKEKTHAYLAAILKNLDSLPIIVGGTANHVHILCMISKNHPLTEIIRELKRGSSRMLKMFATPIKDFKWQNG